MESSSGRETNKTIRGDLCQLALGSKSTLGWLPERKGAALQIRKWLYDDELFSKFFAGSCASSSRRKLRRRGQVETVIPQGRLHWLRTGSPCSCSSRFVTIYEIVRSARAREIERVLANRKSESQQSRVQRRWEEREEWENEISRLPVLFPTGLGQKCIM